MGRVHESLRATLHFERPEEICQFEWGYWPETLARWRQEGMKGNNPWDETGITFYHRVPVETRIFPPFESKTLSETAQTRIVQDGGGVVQEVSKTGTALPRFLRHPVENRHDFEALAERLNPHMGVRFPANWIEAAHRLRTRNSVLVMGNCEISFFGWARDLMGVENLLLADYDQPELWRRIFKKHYRRMLETARDAGLVVMFHSCGNVTEILPDFIEIGLEEMHPLQPEAMDVTHCQKTYGKDLTFWGGLGSQSTIPKGTPDDCRREANERLKLFHNGGYILAPAGAVPTETPAENLAAIAEAAQAQLKELP